MTVAYEISKIMTTLAQDGVTVSKLVFAMTATETDDGTGDRIAQAVIDAAYENPPAGDARDIILKYASDNNWKQILLDELAVKKSIAAKSVTVTDLSTITTAVSDAEVPVSIFKTSTRKTRSSCKACVAHAKNKRFPTAHEVVRAHPKCNCKIVTNHVDTATYTTYFTNSRVHDLRP